MSTKLKELEGVWSEFPELCRPWTVEGLGNHGGFSGARLWRAETNVGQLCLRAWPPEFPSERQLTFIHHVLLQVHAQGLSFVPPPLRTRTGATLVRHHGCLWELTPWMPGLADYHERPTRARLDAAMQALARFHLAAASSHNPHPMAPSPTLERRIRELHSFLNGPAAEELRRQVPDGRWPEMDGRAVRLLDHVDAQRGRLAAMLEQPLVPVPQQPVIRDIWHDHLLFDGDQVSAIIDYGAMSIDTVAVDIARLLGSLVDGDESAWEAGLDAYSELRPLPDNLRELLTTLDETGIIAGGLIWLRWHYLESRTFENGCGVLARVDHFLHRLEAGSSLAHESPSTLRGGNLAVSSAPS